MIFNENKTFEHSFSSNTRTGEYNPQNSRANEDAQLFSVSITRDDRRYYLDLKQNDRGRFLRVCLRRLIKTEIVHHLFDYFLYKTDFDG